MFGVKRPICFLLNLQMIGDGDMTLVSLNRLMFVKRESYIKFIRNWETKKPEGKLVLVLDDLSQIGIDLSTVVAYTASPVYNEKEIKDFMSSSEGGRYNNDIMGVRIF